MGLFGKLFGSSPPSRPDESTILRVPAEGLAHPVFDAFDSEDAMEVYLTFTNSLSGGELKALNSHYHRWADSVDWQALGGEPGFAVESDGQTFRIGFVGVPNPKPAVEALLSAFTNSGFGLREVVLARRQVDEDGSPGSYVDGAVDGEESYGTEEEHWRASFDPSLPAPMAEDPQGLFSMCTMDDGSMVMERRPFHVGQAGVRVAYGLCNVEDRPADARGRQVSEVVHRCLDESFAGRPPALYNKDGEPDGDLDHIEKDGRRGYAFAVKRDDMIIFYPATFRYREVELMGGLARAVSEAGLAPTIHWDRDSVYIINLWEPAATDVW